MPFFVPIARLITVLALAGLLQALSGQSLVVHSGDGQLVTEQYRSTSPMVVRATDAQGLPVAGVEIEWEVSEGEGSLAGIEETTNAQGLAGVYFVADRFFLSDSIRLSKITARSAAGEAQFLVTEARGRQSNGQYASPPLVWMHSPVLSNSAIEAAPGSTLAGGLRLQIVVQSGPELGIAVPNIGVRIVDAQDRTKPVPIACRGVNNMVFTGEDGFATCDIELGQEPGKYRVAAFVGESTTTYMFRITITGDGGGGGTGGGEPAPDPLAIGTGSTLPPGRVGTPYSMTFGATGGTAPYQWNVAGALPRGITFDPETARLGGTPTEVMTSQFTATVTDAIGATVSRNFSLAVNSNDPAPTELTITTTAFPAGRVGEPYQAPVLTAGGCVTPFSPTRLSLTGGAVPPGLDLTVSSLRGTPTQAGLFQFTIEARDNCGAVTERSFTLQVATAGGQTPSSRLSVSRDTLRFEVEAGENTSPTVAVSVTAETASGFIASATTLGGGPWLKVMPEGGVTPGVLTIWASETANLAPGAYQGSVTVAPTVPGTDPVAISVTLEVTGPAELVVAPLSLRFTMRAGAPPPTQQVISVGSSGGELAFEATATTESGGEWLFITATGLTTPASLFVVVNPLGLNPGVYRGAVTVRRADQAGEPLVTEVRMEIPRPNPSVGSVTNGGSFLRGPVAPGEIVVLFGTNMGPADLATLRLDENGRLEDTLGQTRVLFDGMPAPLLHSSSGQVGAIVPYGVAGRGRVNLTVEYQGLRSEEIELEVMSAAPGIFTISEAGQGAILNQDGTLNSASRPAAAGDWISIFATGEGATNPPVPDGSIITVESVDDLPRPMLPVVVEIGGVRAQVQYAGSAPSLPAGVLQVNVIVPEGAGAGPVAITIRVGDYSSQGGVTVALE